jgi:hypothetical protein
LRQTRKPKFYTMSNVKQGAFSDPMPGRPIHVTVPVSLSFDLEKMQKLTREVLGKLGHVGCHSGFDLRFNHEIDFSFNERGELFQH